MATLHSTLPSLFCLLSHTLEEPNLKNIYIKKNRVNTEVKFPQRGQYYRPVLKSLHRK